MQHNLEQQNESLNDPFSFGYLLAILVTLLALPLMHVILGWLVFYL
jgi:hypothetical protein